MPIFFHKGQNNLFIHIPKTGGSSVVSWLTAACGVGFHSDSRPQPLGVSMQHLTYRDIKLFFPPDFFDFCFCIVRNPFDRIISEYNMRLALRKEGFFQADLDFSTWLHDCIEHCAKNSMYMDNHIRPQWHFLAQDVKFYRFEDGISQIIKDISARTGLGLPQHTPHKYRAPDTAKRVQWDPVDIRLVTDFYGGDFDMFDYPTTPQP